MPASTQKSFSVLAHFDTLPDSARVRKPVVLGLTGYSNNTLYRRIAAGQFPAPHKDGRIASWQVGSLRAVLKGTN